MVRSTTIAVLLTLVLSAPATSQPHPERIPEFSEGVDFRVYGPDGQERTLLDIIAALDDVDALLVGEHHSDRIGHEVEEELLIGAARRYGVIGEGVAPARPLVVSMEFFERDVQVVLDEYLAGLITEEQFLELGRPWDNYHADYRPLVQFAWAHELPVIAANAPRRYVNLVTRYGPGVLDRLTDDAKRFLPPLPYPGPSAEYETQFHAEMMEGMEATAEAEADPEMDAPRDRRGRIAPPDHGMGFALQSQALWDASMGHAITGALERHEGALVIHYVGGFHVARHTGIPEQVLHYRPESRILTVNMEPVEDIDSWDEDEHEGLADFVILTAAPPALKERQDQ